MPATAARMGVVLKVFPRFSETFVVNELLAHERAALELEIFSLRPPLEGRFHERLARLRSPVRYVQHGHLRADPLWEELMRATGELPGLPGRLAQARGEDAETVYQALVVARAARAGRLSHLHAHFATVAASVARLAAAFAGLPYSMTAHAKDIFHAEVREEDLRRKLHDAAVTVTVSDFNARHLRALCPEAADRIVRVYNGLELREFPFRSPRHRGPLIGAVGRLVEKKGFDDLVRACALLAARERPFRCDIAGAGPEEPALAALIRELGLHDRVRLLGPRSQEEVKRLLERAAVCAAPCKVGADGNRDGLPTVLLEAMALGTPCVSTAVTGIPEAVRDGVTGTTVPERDPVALAAALDRLLADGEERLRLAAAARALIEAEFDVDRNGTRLREHLIGRRAAPRAREGTEDARRLRVL